MRRKTWAFVPRCEGPAAGVQFLNFGGFFQGLEAQPYLERIADRTPSSDALAQRSNGFAQKMFLDDCNPRQVISTRGMPTKQTPEVLAVAKRACGAGGAGRGSLLSGLGMSQLNARSGDWVHCARSRREL